MPEFIGVVVALYLLNRMLVPQPLTELHERKQARRFHAEFGTTPEAGLEALDRAEAAACR